MITHVLLMLLSLKGAVSPDPSLLSAVLEVVVDDATDYRRGDRPSQVWLLPSATEGILSGSPKKVGTEPGATVIGRTSAAVHCSSNGCKIDGNGIAIQTASATIQRNEAVVIVDYQVQWHGPGSRREAPGICPRKLQIDLQKTEGEWRVISTKSLREC